MGLFSSKKKTYVNTTVQKIFQEHQIPDSVKTGIIKGIFGDDDVFESMMEEVVSSVGIRADTGYSWAKKNDYYWGLPSSSTKSSITARDLVLSTIARITGQAITPDYYLYGPMNSIHYGWQTLVSLLSYNPSTNEIIGLSGETGFPCFLKDMVATYRAKEYNENVALYDLAPYEQWGPAPASGYTPSKPFNLLTGMGQYAKQSAYEISDVAVDDYITITYEFKDAAGVIQTRGRTFSMAAIDLSVDYHQCRFKKANGVISFFTYKEKTGTYPEIDTAFDTSYSDFGTFYPWSYLRYDNRNIGADSHSASKQFVDSKRWLKYMGVDYMTLSDGVNADPDVDDVAQSILLFGVNPAAQHQEEIEYLFKYFSLLHENAIAHSQQTQTLLEEFDSYTASPSQVMSIQDRYFKMNLVFSGIEKRNIPGSIGVIGTYTNTNGAVPISTNLSTITATGVTAVQAVAGSQPYYTYRKQVSDNEYEEVRVYNPSLHYAITYKKGFSAGPGAAELLIPVDRAIVRTMSVRKKEKLLTRSLYMVVNTVIKVKTPWYASTIFKWVMVIIAIVITVLSAGTAAASLAAAFALGATALVIAIVQMIVVSLAIKYAVKLFVKKFGPKVGIIAAVAAMVVGGYMSNTGTVGSGTEYWGENLIMVSSNIAKEASTEFAVMTKDVITELTDFNDWAKGQWSNLQEQREELGLEQRAAGLDGLVFVNSHPLVVIGESPSAFYDRTIHSGNIGAMSFDVASGYVDASLTLPTIGMSQEVFNRDQPE